MSILVFITILIIRSMLENVLKGGFATGSKKKGNVASTTGTNLSDFRFEYAKSGGSKCGVCEEKIAKVNDKFSFKTKFSY